MNYTNALLDRVKAKFELTSDYQLAKKLEIRATRISNYRNGVSNMDWDLAFKICDLLEEDDQNVVHGLIEDKYSNPRLINALHSGQAS
ncbi:MULTISPECIES: transcriptional regulator [unclassified Vibrio]|uniref:transcriptional regulator n=1 Tax=unclassified Vibrio TaxID=2614977 RepID=UPI0013616033|nr:MULTISPECIES: transcriptional regulator [unclassified Vibrio]NAW57790.1 transcriptional regulator [Vibrio sp. V36_P2S2PM302]NAX24630.1 transcriptional regulator [Vibrio sp. V38_P2S17PM301]NAX29588.1 transcriptional regulator [Vibrio sp. V37_P2S8PM304]